MPVKAPPVVMPTLYNWSGVYIGVEGGAVMGQNSDWLLCTNGTCTGVPEFFPNVGHPMHGGFVGGEAGFNWQPVGSRWVFGIEGDGNWAEIEEALTCPGGPFSCGSRISDFETVRARIGYALGPRGDFLAYVTGGWATANQSAFSKQLSTPFATTEQWLRHDGFAVGGGAEYGITPWLSLKAEVLYVWLESRLHCVEPGVGSCAPPPGIFEPVRVKDDFILARMGLNWRFWWGKAPTPLVARY
jgi:outer membrane immunogenic protein